MSGPRSDLNKILCERERAGGSVTKGLKRRDSKVKQGVTTWPFRGESTSPFPYKEGMMKNHNSFGNRKNFNENLNALWGFVRKSVGKRWDTVYGEICSVFDKRKVINQHVLLHLLQNVQIHTFMHEGRVTFTDERGWKSAGNRQKPVEEGFAEYYVHPVSRILLQVNRNKHKKIKVQKKAEKKKENEKHLRLLANFDNKTTGKGSRYAIKINDVWYEISVVKAPEPTKHRRLNASGGTEYYTRFPEINAVSIHGAKIVPTELISNNNYYVCRKEQLNKKRIRDLGLN